MTLQQALQQLKEKHPSSVIVFLGAGFASDLGFPLWRPFLAEIAAFVERFDADLAKTVRKRTNSHLNEHAADPLFEPEVPPTERARFFIQRFEARPPLVRRHKIVGAMPVAAFITTNYDSTLERSIGFEDRRTPVVFTGPSRFALFSSALQVYRDDYPERVGRSALVLKAHSDYGAPADIVLCARSFAALRQDPAFRQFYSSLLRTYHLLFLGFGGQDDNLLMQATAVVAEFAGYGLKDSYLLLPEGTTPPGGIRDTPITPVFYDPANGHAALDGFVEELNFAWRSTVFPEPGKPAQKISLPPTDESAPNIFELMAVAFREGADARVLDAVAAGMIDTAARIASPDVAPASVANKLSQHYRVSPKLADALIARHYTKPATPPAKAARSGVDESALLLAGGLRARCVAVDPSFLPSDLKLVPVVRSVVEGSLQAYGCSISLALVKGDRPRHGDLSHLVRDMIRPGVWDGIGDVECSALSLAIPDLFLKPTEAEGRVLAHLAVTATSFGLLQALPAGDIQGHLTPSAIFLDTTCVLPLLARVEPRYSAYSPLFTLARSRGIRLVFQRTFVNEVATHYKRAAAFLRDNDIRSVSALQQALRGSLIEYANVFLASLIQGRYDGSSSPLKALASLFVGNEDEFALEIRRMGVEVADFAGDAAEIERVKSLIVTSKQNWYERTVTAREILARNEASQLLELERISTTGPAAWFATGDTQLRRVARERDLPGAQFVLPVGGAVALLESLSNGADLGAAFARMLWAPNTQDQIDQRLASELSTLLQEGKLELDGPLPIEEARQIAAAEFRESVQRAKRTDDLEIDTAPGPVDLTKMIGESVYKAIGQALDSKRKKA